MLILHGMPAWPWALGGAALGVITLLLMGIPNRRLGISTAYEDVCAIVSRLPYFRRPAITGSERWRLYFLVGLFAGGALSNVLGGGFSTSWELGAFSAALGFSPLGLSTWMFAGGLCIGFGTRLAGGCTSGHGIFGIANLEPASWVSTVTFMASGIVMTNFVWRVLFPGATP